MNEQSSSAKTATSDHSLSVGQALLVGWLWVNLPAVVIILGVLILGSLIELRLWWLFLAIGGFLGWTWWSFTIGRWRRWSLTRGAPPERLQKWAVIVLLTWPKGSLPEKTEIQPRD
jgi:hypothetical protein